LKFVEAVLICPRFYSGPLRGVFQVLNRRNVLRDVQTLILDGLSVTAELCNDIINDPSYNVRILSIRDVKNLNHGKLRGSLQYACRRTRPEGTPKLKALYLFGSKDTVATSAAVADHSPSSSIIAQWNHKSQQALTSSLEREGDAWWSKKGRIVTKHVPDEWAQCILACEGIIAFDAVLCHGPRHRNSHVFGTTPLRADTRPAVATFALPPCDGCGKSPEGVVDPAGDVTQANVPLLAPPPILSSSLRAAKSPRQPATPFVSRCLECLRERYCATCHKWWCESCYMVPGHEAVNTVIVVDEDGALGAMDGLQSEMAVPKPKVRKDLCLECENENESTARRAAPT
jgi:hypothetical protein